MAPLKKDGLTFCDRQNQANIMGNQFSSVYTTEDTADLPDLGPSNTQRAPPINVEAKGIQKLLKDLKPHKASGPDSIPTRLLNSRRRTSPRTGSPIPDLHRQRENPPGLEDGSCHTGFQEGQQIRPRKLPFNFSYLNCLQDLGTCYPQLHNQSL